MTALPKDEMKKDRIIKAAVKIFSRDGLHKGKIADIAEEAGIGKGTVYEYFRSKDEIFEAIFGQFFNQMFEGFRLLVNSDKSPLQKINEMFNHTFDLLAQMTGENGHGEENWLIYFEIFLQCIRDDFKDMLTLPLKEIIKEFIEIISPVIDQGIKSGIFRSANPEYLSFILFASLDGIYLYYFLNHKSLDFEQLKRSTTDTFLNGILINPIESTEGDN